MDDTTTSDAAAVAESHPVSAVKVSEKAAESTTTKGNKMGQPVNVFATPADGSSGAAGMLPMAMMAGMNHGGLGSGMGAGLGAGLVGGVLGGLLFGRGGLGGFGNGIDGAVNGRAAAALDGTDGMALMQAIGMVKDTVNSGTASVTGAITNGNMMLTNAVTSGDNMLNSTIQNGFAMQNSNTLQQTIMLTQQGYQTQMQLQQEICGVNQNVSAQGCMTRETVNADGAATRALITAQYEANLQRQLGVAEVALLEANRRRDHDAVIASITNTNTAVAAQAQGQAQQQQQQILSGISQLFPVLQGLTQIAHATNSNVVAGNTGATTIAAQTASPTNVNTGG
jgi:hypothetical protein